MYPFVVFIAVNTVLEITVSHPTLSGQIFKMSSQFHIMIGHYD